MTTLITPGEPQQLEGVQASGQATGDEHQALEVLGVALGQEAVDQVDAVLLVGVVGREISQADLVVDAVPTRSRCLGPRGRSPGRRNRAGRPRTRRRRWRRQWRRCTRRTLTLTPFPPGTASRVGSGTSPRAALRAFRGTTVMAFTGPSPVLTRAAAGTPVCVPSPVGPTVARVGEAALMLTVR
jgi:hypothetical protein